MSDRSSTGFFPKAERVVWEEEDTRARAWMPFAVKALVLLSVAAMATMMRVEDIRRRENILLLLCCRLLVVSSFCLVLL